MKIKFEPAIQPFLGARLKEAREARGLTITQLAALTGISKQSISYYEKDAQRPRGEALSKLINALGVTLAFLQKSVPPRSLAPIFFRSLASLKKKERSRAKIQLGWFEELYDFLSMHISFVQPNLPRDLDISGRIGKTDMFEIDEIAGKVRHYWGLGNGPISNVTRLLENNGIVILKMDLDVSQEDAFSQWQLDSTLPVIVSVADTLAACRQRFTLAHELGHLILHSKIGRIENDKLKLIEKQAHRFASAFLLPASTWLMEFRAPELESFRHLKGRWKVSIAAQIHRARDLDIISEETARRLHASLASRKWKTLEPLDDTIPHEHPVMLNEAMELLQTQMDISEICAAVSLPESDIRILSGMQFREAQLKSQTDKPVSITCFNSQNLQKRA